MRHDHHHHPPADPGRVFAIGIGLNLAFVALEALAGLLAGSLALLADAGHNFSDVLGLLLAWWATRLGRRPPTARRTYGLRRSSILAALFNALLLLLAVGAMSWEAVHRLVRPTEVSGRVVIAVAAAGVVVNGATALLLVRGRHDLNVRGAFLHMAADAAVSLGVVIGGIVIALSGWTWIDPLLTLIIAGVITIGTWGLLRQSIDLSLDAVPASIDPAAVRGYLAGQPGVTEVHDLHIWAISTADVALTAHVVRPGTALDDHWLASVADGLHARFGIGHVTLQVEAGDPNCKLAPDDVI